MMRSLLLFYFTSMLFCSARSQGLSELKRVGARKKHTAENGWIRNSLFVLNVNQSSQSEWSSGGENFMIGISGILNNSVHHRKGKFTFDHYFDLELGVVDAASFKSFRKTADRCDITFEAEHSIGKKHHFNYGMLANLNTQFFAGLNYGRADHPKISSFLSPGKFLFSVGIDYVASKDNRYFSLFMTPVTFRWITKLDNDFYKVKKYGVDSFKKVYSEVGAYISLNYNNRISKTFSIISRLDLFSNYKRKAANVDLLVNNVLSYTFSKYLAGTFLLDILYDDDVKKRTQVQEVIGLGLKLKL